MGRFRRDGAAVEADITEKFSCSKHSMHGSERPLSNLWNNLSPYIRSTISQAFGLLLRQMRNSTVHDNVQKEVMASSYNIYMNMLN